MDVVFTFGSKRHAIRTTGILKDFSVTKQWAQYVEHLEPDPAKHRLYHDYFELYKKLYLHLKDDYEELARLRARS